jgi:hypothetical protein
LMAIYSQIAGVSWCQAQAETQTQLYHSRTDQRLDSMDNNICRITMQPVQCIRHGGKQRQQQYCGGREGGTNCCDSQSKPKKPSSALTSRVWVWYREEKASKAVYSHQRGGLEFKYCRRKVVWTELIIQYEQDFQPRLWLARFTRYIVRL